MNCEYCDDDYATLIIVIYKATGTRPVFILLVFRTLKSKGSGNC